MSTWWRRLSLGHPDGEGSRLTGRSQSTDRSGEDNTIIDRCEGQGTLGARHQHPVVSIAVPVRKPEEHWC